MIRVYDDCFNNVVTSKSGGGGDDGNMVMLPWLPFHNRLMKLSYFWRCTTRWLILMSIILVSLYFVKGERYEHSLIIYWTVSLYIEQPSYFYTSNLTWVARPVSKHVNAFVTLYRLLLFFDQNNDIEDICWMLV